MIDTKLSELLGDKQPISQSVREHLKQVGIDDFSTVNIARSTLVDVLKNISSDGASLGKKSIIRVLDGFGYHEGTSIDEDREFLNIWRKQRRPNKDLRSIIEARRDAGLEQIEDKLSELSSRLDGLSKIGQPNLAELKETIAEIKEQSRKFAAPIKIPAPKDMEVRLVSADSLQRLSEYNADINIFLTLASVFFGSFLGMLGNLFSGANITNSFIGVIVILAVVSVVFAFLYKRIENRKKSISDAVLNDEQSVYIDDYNA